MSNLVYISAYPGIVGDGVTDDRNAFVVAIADVSTNGRALVIDTPIKLDVASNINKPIFMPDNLTMNFLGNGKFIVNNVNLPTFVFEYAKNITITNFTAIWDGDITTLVNMVYPDYQAIPYSFNNTIVTPWLSANRAIIFTSRTAVGCPPSDWSALMVFQGDTSNIYFKGKTSITSKNPTQVERMLMSACSFNYGWKRNTAVNGSTVVNSSTCSQPSQIFFDDVYIDGVGMGFVGQMNDVHWGKVYSDHYTYPQDAAGNFGAWFSPPHLFYFSYTSAIGLDIKNSSIGEVYDAGNYVGASGTWPLGGGYPNSLKIGGQNITVGKYISYRPHGGADIICKTGGTNVVINDFYSEYDSSIFRAEFIGSIAGNTLTVTSMISGIIIVGHSIASEADITSNTTISAYGSGTGGVGTYSLTQSMTVASQTIYSLIANPNVRFPGGDNASGYDTLKINNMEVVDVATKSIISPMGGSSLVVNKNCQFINLRIRMKDFVGGGYPGFFFPGSGHHIDSEIILENHNQVHGFRGVACYESGSVNHVYHRARVRGWRDISSNFDGLSNRVLFVPNGLYGNRLELSDVNNQHEYVVENGLVTHFWTRELEFTPTAGGTYTTSLIIPASVDIWSVVGSVLKVVTAFGTTGGLTGLTAGYAGATAAFGTLSAVAINTNVASDAVVTGSPSARTVILTPIGGTFDGTGKVRVVLKLKRTSAGF